MTPSIPDMPSIFGTDIKAAQLTVGINLSAYALAQLVHGSLSDVFGRRKLLVWGFCLFAIVSIACTFATTIEGLLFGRFAQGLLSSVPSVVIILIIRELYGSQGAVKVMALYGAALGAAPALGPLVGGYLHVWFGWTASFWTIAILALLMASAFFIYVPETLETRQKFELKKTLHGYLQLLKRREFVRLTLSLSLTFGAYFAYVTTAPAIFIDQFGLATQHYGLTYLVVILAFIAGNIIAGNLSTRLDGAEMIQVAFSIKMIAILIFVVALITDYVTMFSILGAMTIFSVGFAIAMAAGPIVLLDKVPDLPQGLASALFGACQLSAAALAGILSALFYAGGVTSMVLTMTGFVILGAVLLPFNPIKLMAASEN